MVRGITALVRYFASLAKRFIALVGRTAPMVKVFLVLIGSLLAVPIVESDLFGEVIFSIDYTLYRTSMALVYLLLSAIGLWLARVELKKRNNFSAALICILCFFMTFNALLNLLMVNSDMYYALACFKKGLDCNTLTFHDVYRAVEVLIAFIVGLNVLSYNASVVICDHGRPSVIIRDDTNST